MLMTSGLEAKNPIDNSKKLKKGDYTHIMYTAQRQKKA